MLIVPAAFALLTTIPRPAATPRPMLDTAIAAAARQSSVRLEPAPQHQRGEPYQLSPKTGRRVAFVIIGAVVGFYGSIEVVAAASHGESMPPLGVVIGASIGGGVLGGLLAGK
jgi:hypothetical protein